MSVEFSHLLTDGNGAFEYLTTLLVTYFKELGIQTPDSFMYMKMNSQPDSEEFEDAYNRYFQEEVPAASSRPRAFHLPFPLRKKPRLDVVFAMLSASELKQKAEKHGVSITVYLIAVYLHVLQELFEDLPRHSKYRRFKKLGIEVPINLQKLYPTKPCGIFRCLSYRKLTCDWDTTRLRSSTNGISSNAAGDLQKVDKQNLSNECG